MSGNPNSEKTYKLVMTGLMMCLVTMAIMLFKIPVFQGYVHLGNSMMFMAVMVLGKKNGAIASGLGAALGDVIGGFAVWAPWSLVVSGGMALIVGLLMEKNKKVLGLILGGVFLVAGYYIAEVVIYGNVLAPMAGVPWNIGQYAFGVAIAYILTKAICKTPAEKYFAIKAD